MSERLFQPVRIFLRETGNGPVLSTSGGKRDNSRRSRSKMTRGDSVRDWARLEVSWIKRHRNDRILRFYGRFVILRPGFAHLLTSDREKMKTIVPGMFGRLSFQNGAKSVEGRIICRYCRQNIFKCSISSDSIFAAAAQTNSQAVFIE
jgi:hypothetical protein